ncbi:MAG TPA: hypothetical protein VH107_06555 [Lacipirellulaceae bacterium]|jgi:hypothetical protein|nr:hypothetical protein [Lacipirellulaceae bacterium]
MSKPGDNRDFKSQPSSAANKSAKPAAKVVTSADFFSLASFLQRREQLQRGHKRESQGEAIRAAGEFYHTREYAAAYEAFKTVYDRVAADMQRVLARSPELEAKKMAEQQGKSLSVAKENVQQMRAHAQQLADQFEKLRQDLENKPLVRLHIKQGRTTPKAAPELERTSADSAPTSLDSANETRFDAGPSLLSTISVESNRYTKAPYAPPEVGTLYAVRDKSKTERIIRVIAIAADRAKVQVDIAEPGSAGKKPIELAVDSLAHQAAHGRCHLLVPVHETAELISDTEQQPTSPLPDASALRIDIQNFGRCCASIARANIKFSTQLIKDVGDGAFRAGKYEKAFLTFEQLAVGFTSAVNASRQAIAEGRRRLTAEKGHLSGKEILERTAAFTRGEQLIFSAEREFATILEGLRMYLIAKDLK